MGDAAARRGHADAEDSEVVDWGEGGSSAGGSGGSGGGGRSGLFPESLRRVLVSGMSGLFMTEETVRGALGDFRLPKDAIAFLAQQGERTRKELYRVIAEELKSFLNNMDLPGEFRKALSGLRVEVNIRFHDEAAGEGEGERAGARAAGPKVTIKARGGAGAQGAPEGAFEASAGGDGAGGDDARAARPARAAGLATTAASGSPRGAGTATGAAAGAASKATGRRGAAAAKGAGRGK